MIDEKEYFDFSIGKFHFTLRQNYEYTDRKTGKVHMNKRFRIYTYNDNDGIQLIRKVTGNSRSIRIYIL